MEKPKNTVVEDIKSGSIYALCAYLGWGFVPIYWKLLKHVPFLQILCHRVVWAFVFYSVILFFREKKLSVFTPKSLRLNLALLAASFLLMSNWLVYIYAVNSDQIVESSLGYFINPLVNIVLGVFLLGEKLSKIQKTATLLAGAGVLTITLSQGSVPWIALFLAVSFSLYGFIKKKVHVESLKSNQFESLVMLLPAVVFLFNQPLNWMTDENRNLSLLLLVGGGVVTGVPLLFFSAAAQRIPYYLMGFFQFLSPSMQFLTGVLIFNEPLSSQKLFGFSLIWLAGLLLIFKGWQSYRAKKAVSV